MTFWLQICLNMNNNCNECSRGKRDFVFIEPNPRLIDKLNPYTETRYVDIDETEFSSIRRMTICD